MLHNHNNARQHNIRAGRGSLEIGLMHEHYRLCHFLCNPNLALAVARQKVTYRDEDEDELRLLDVLLDVVNVL